MWLTCVSVRRVVVSCRSFDVRHSIGVRVAGPESSSFCRLSFVSRPGRHPGRCIAVLLVRLTPNTIFGARVAGPASSSSCRLPFVRLSSNTISGARVAGPASRQLGRRRSLTGTGRLRCGGRRCRRPHLVPHARPRRWPAQAIRVQRRRRWCVGCARMVERTAGQTGEGAWQGGRQGGAAAVAAGRRGGEEEGPLD